MGPAGHHQRGNFGVGGATVGDGLGVDVAPVRIVFEQASEATVAQRGGRGGGVRGRLGGADESGVVGVDDGGVLKDLYDAAKGGPLRSA